MSNNPFRGTSAIVLQEGGKYFPCAKGKYLCAISRVLIKDSRESGELFTVELEVLESDNSEVDVGETRTWQTPFAAPDAKGEFKSFKLAKSAEHRKKFAIAMLGVHPSDQQGQAKVLSKLDDALYAACEEGKYNGVLLSVRTEPLTTKAGGQFTMHTFSPGQKAA